FAHPSYPGGPELQAEFAWKWRQEYGGDLPMFLDLEANPIEPVIGGTETDWATKWMVHYAEISGERPGLYISSGLWETHFGEPRHVRTYFLWLAQWSQQSPDADEWDIWQDGVYNSL